MSAAAQGVRAWGLADDNTLRYLDAARPQLPPAPTVSLGAAALRGWWAFAEGATGFFHTYLLIGNPNPGTAEVTVTAIDAINRRFSILIEAFGSEISAPSVTAEVAQYRGGTTAFDAGGAAPATRIPTP